MNEPRRARTSIVALRLAAEEVLTLERAAEQAHESVSDYVRKAIDLRQRGVTVPPTVNLSAGAIGMQINQWVTWTEAPNSYTPDEVTHLS
jgi:hypothetical protein